MTESDPNNISPHEPGAKLDSGKLQAGLLEDFSLALMAVIEVADYGSRKYSKGGWISVADGIERYNNAAWRHRLKKRYEEFDESGLSHEQMELWNLLAVVELKLRKKLEEGK